MLLVVLVGCTKKAPADEAAPSVNEGGKPEATVADSEVVAPKPEAREPEAREPPKASLERPFDARKRHDRVVVPLGDAHETFEKLGEALIPGDSMETGALNDWAIRVSWDDPRLELPPEIHEGAIVTVITETGPVRGRVDWLGFVDFNASVQLAARLHFEGETPQGRMAFFGTLEGSPKFSPPRPASSRVKKKLLPRIAAVAKTHVAEEVKPLRPEDVHVVQGSFPGGHRYLATWKVDNEYDEYEAGGMMLFDGKGACSALEELRDSRVNFVGDLDGDGVDEIDYSDSDSGAGYFVTSKGAKILEFNVSQEGGDGYSFSGVDVKPSQLKLSPCPPIKDAEAPENEGDAEIVGVWQDFAMVPAGYTNVHVFRPDGTWRWHRNQMVCRPGVLAREGAWRREGDTLVLEQRSATTWSGGKCEDVGGSRKEEVGGKTNEVTKAATWRVKIEPCPKRMKIDGESISRDDLEPAVACSKLADKTFGEAYWFRGVVNPDDFAD